MRRGSGLWAAAVSACLAASATAQEAVSAKKWKDAAELSYVQTSGNSKSSTLSAKNLFNYDWERAALELAAAGLGAESRDAVTAEQYSASEKVSLKLPGKNYTFERAGWSKDRFAGIRDRYDLGLGVGRNLLDLEKDKLYAEAGGGYVFEDRLSSEDQSFATYRGYAKYVRSLSATANIGQDVEYLGNLKEPRGYRMNAESSLTAAISTHFSLKAAYLWKFVNSPPAGFLKNDTTTSMSIIVNY